MRVIQATVLVFFKGGLRSILGSIRVHQRLDEGTKISGFIGSVRVLKGRARVSWKS